MARDDRRPRVEIRRRRRADGTVSEVPTVRYTDAAGVRRRRRCASVEDAEFERARLALELTQNGRLDGPMNVLTVGEFWPTYRADAGGRLAEQTLLDYDGTWRRRVEPRFGDVRLDAIAPRDVSRWRVELQVLGVGREAVRRAMVLLQAMFTLAVEWGEITHNPVALVRKPRQGRTRAIEVLEPRVVEQIRERLLADGDLFSATLVSVLAYAGVRPGEALALERRHVRNDTMLVEQAVSHGKLKLQKTGRVYRTVDLLAALREDLSRWFEHRGDESANAPLFPRGDGDWFRSDDWDNWRKRRFHSATTAVGIAARGPTTSATRSPRC
jgi:integrase